MFNHLRSDAQLSEGDVKNKNIPLRVFVHETHPVHIYLSRLERTQSLTLGGTRIGQNLKTSLPNLLYAVALLL